MQYQNTWGKSTAKVFSVQFSSVQSLSRVWLFATPWITARQYSLSITNSQSKGIRKLINKNMWFFWISGVCGTCQILEICIEVFFHSKQVFILVPRKKKEKIFYNVILQTGLQK